MYNTLYSTWNGKKSRTQTFSETGGVSAEGGGVEEGDEGDEKKRKDEGGWKR